MAKIFRIHSKRTGRVNQSLNSVTSVSTVETPTPPTPPTPPSPNLGRMTSSLTGLSSSSTSRLNIKASVNKVLASLSLSANSTLAVIPARTGIVVKTLAGLSGLKTAKLYLKASVSKTLSSLSLSSLGTQPSINLKLGMNTGGQGWDASYLQDRFQSSPGSGYPAWETNLGSLPAANLDSDRWPSSLPGGAAWVGHTIANPPVPGWKYYLTWTGDMPRPTNLWEYTIDSWDNVAKVAVITPTNNSSTSPGNPPELRYVIPDPAHPPKNIKAMPIIGGVVQVGTWDPTVQSSVTGATSGGPIRFMDASGVNFNGSGSPTCFQPWGGASQASPNYTVTLANRSTATGGEWTPNRGDRGSPANDGLPIEVIVDQGNTYNRPIWITLHWNAQPSLVQFYADYVRDNLNSNLTCYIEVGNEVWNGGFAVESQCRLEAQGVYRTSGVDLNTMNGNLTWGMARYAEKLKEYFGYFKTRFDLPRTDLGAKASLVRVCAWQHGTNFSNWLNYDPAGGTAYLKTYIDAISTAPYFGCANTDLTCGGGNYDPARGTTPIANAMWTAADWAADLCANYQAVATAANLRYVAYEMGPSVVGLDNDNTTCASVAATYDRSTTLGQQISYYLQRLQAVIPGSAVNWYAMVGTPSSTYGSWGLLETQYQDPSTNNKYKAVLDYISGKRKLVSLDGTLITSPGATVGTIVGFVRRRLPGSIVTVNSPFSVVDSTANVLQIKISDATAFTSAGTLTCTITETGGVPVTSVTTNLPCTVTSSNYFSPNVSDSGYQIEDAGSTIRRVSANLTGNYVDGRTILGRTDGYFELIARDAGNSSVGLVATSTTLGPGSDAHSIQWHPGGNVYINQTLAATVPGWVNGDNLGWAISPSKKLYLRKNGGLWYGAGTNVTSGVSPAADTGGINLSTVATVPLYPALHAQTTASTLTAKLTDASFAYTKPVGYHDWT